MDAMPFPAQDLLRCPVCAGAWDPWRSSDRSLVCGSGHRFDAARQGYINFLTGRGTRFVPDTADMVSARDRFLTAGHYAPIAGALVNRFGERTLMVGALFLQAVGIAWIGLISRPDLPYVELVAPLLVAGCASAAIPAGQNAVISSVAANEIGKASGTFNMLRQLGTTFGVAITAAVFAGTGSFHSAQAFSNGFAPAMGVCAALSLIGAIVALVLPGRSEKALSQTKAKVPETRESEAVHLGERFTRM